MMTVAYRHEHESSDSGHILPDEIPDGVGTSAAESETERANFPEYCFISDVRELIYREGEEIEVSIKQSRRISRGNYAAADAFFSIDDFSVGCISRYSA